MSDQGSVYVRPCGGGAALLRPHRDPCNLKQRAGRFSSTAPTISDQATGLCRREQSRLTRAFLLFLPRSLLRG